MSMWHVVVSIYLESRYSQSTRRAQAHGRAARRCKTPATAGSSLSCAGSDGGGLPRVVTRAVVICAACEMRVGWRRETGSRRSGWRGGRGGTCGSSVFRVACNVSGDPSLCGSHVQPAGRRRRPAWREVLVGMWLGVSLFGSRQGAGGLVLKILSYSILANLRRWLFFARGHAGRRKKENRQNKRGIGEEDATKGCLGLHFSERGFPKKKRNLRFTLPSLKQTRRGSPR